MTPLEYIRLVAKEFDSKTDEEFNAFIAMAPLFFNVNAYFGETQNLAIAYKAASLMYDSFVTTSSGGSITQEREGDLSRSYSNVTKDKTGKANNKYDQLLAQLSKAITGATIMTRFGQSANNDWLAFSVSFATYGI